MYTVPGIPCVYQGTEVGNMGYKDPFNRRPFSLDDQDEEMKDFVRSLGKYRENNKDVLATADAKIVRATEDVLAPYGIIILREC